MVHIVEIKKREKGSQVHFETGRVFGGKKWGKRTGDDLVLETRENKRSPNMQNVTSLKRVGRKIQQISLKPLFFT